MYLRFLFCSCLLLSQVAALSGSKAELALPWSDQRLLRVFTCRKAKSLAQSEEEAVVKGLQEMFITRRYM